MRLIIFFLGIFLFSCSSNVKPESDSQSNLGQKQSEVEIEKNKEGINIIFNDVLFTFNKVNLKPQAIKVLKKIVLIIKENPYVNITIEGHSDNIGSEWAKEKIALGRAEEVKKFLIKNGISSSKIVSRGVGDRYPRVPNNSKSNRQKNRRVEIQLLS